MEKPAWGAVFAVALGVAGLSTAEMLPASLLTPMASDLHISEGLAGQTVTATAVVGLVTSLVIAAAARNLNRRALLLLLAGLQVVSNLLVALAPTLPLLLLGRLLLGVAVGGFWSFSASVAMRLVPEARVPRAFSIIFGGAAIASVAAAPMATTLDAIIGWRNVFLVVAALALVAFVWQVVTLPSMPARGRTQLATIVRLLQRRPIQLGTLGVVLSFAGTAACSTYLRPFLEQVTHVSVGELSGILLGMGIASFAGTSLAGPLIERSLRLT